MLSHQCSNRRCGCITFTCNRTCDGIENGVGKRYSDSYKDMKQVRRHHAACHKIAPPSDVRTMAEIEPIEFPDGGYTCDELSDAIAMDCAASVQGGVTDGMEPSPSAADSLEENWPSFHTSETNTEKFQRHLVNGNAVVAASGLVTQAAFQTPNGPPSLLPIPNIMLFLYLARLVMSSGLIQQHYLSKLLLILYPYVDRCQENWAPMPCTVSGFRSQILNVSNSNSLVSILPIPSPETLPDGHGYTPLREILKHAFMMKKFGPSDHQDQKWRSLASSKKFKTFLRDIEEKTPTEPSLLRQLAVGVLLWTDGWDPSTGCKSNRSPMHTGTITLVIVDMESQQVVGVVTYPNMGGPGKIDHGPVFRRLLEDIAAFEKDGSDRVFSSCHYGSDVEVHARIMFVVQDQPERRCASGLLGGGSKLHAMYGMSCDFTGLRLPFPACPQCVDCLEDYLDAEDWTHPPMEVGCEYCLGWSIERLTKTSYSSSFDQPRDSAHELPGDHLFRGPGRLSSRLLAEAWDHCIDMFAHQHEWLEDDVRRYLGQMCINDATIVSFIESCRAHIYLEDIANNPGDFTLDEINECELDNERNPESYTLPRPPAMWSLGDTEDKTEGIMHLSMGIQKAVFKFVIQWATENRNGAQLQRRLADNLSAVQDLKIAYCPCRPYKDEKFSGFTAEGYRAMTLTSLYIYRSLLEADLQPLPPRQPNSEPQTKWTKQDNINWMYLRGIQHPSGISATEAKEQVRREMAKSTQPKIINTLPEQITTDEIRDLIWRMYNMFRAIFCTDLDGIQAKNRATASVMRFLSLMEVLDRKLNPKRERPIWIAKFNFLGLLRVCESFVQFKHVRNLYEGGEIGEAIVKQLRPFVPKGLHVRWATNLLLAHYRNCTLDLLIDALEDKSAQQTGCLLGDGVLSSKFKRYSTSVEVNHQLENGRPIPVLLYGSPVNWRAGAVVVSQNYWYFKEMVFEVEGDIVDDRFGLTYHRVQSSDTESCFGKVDGEIKETVGDDDLTFWGYALMFADLIEDRERFRYAIVSEGWQYLNADNEWSEHD